MNNKRLGTEFEREVCKLLKREGFWVHFLNPNASGAQPFDIIAIRNGRAVAIDCKTSAQHVFPISRLEDNQVFAFEKWAECGNGDSFVLVKFGGRIYAISYRFLKKYGKADMWNMEPWEV